MEWLPEAGGGRGTECCCLTTTEFHDYTTKRTVGLVGLVAHRVTIHSTTELYT